MNRVLKRCALYTRKSSEEGLEQSFNSLDAQREACAAFVKSQSGEGWRARDECYDDGGYSGASMERPGLKALLVDIAAGHIDVVVVYKIDRLTRSLADFARMVEIFDCKGVSFVSVTQAFNTTTSMGRLTLNVLLSFAQFEREVTGERIRDKIAASKARGMWMGGIPPFGYDLPEADNHTLLVNEAEAVTVRAIFASYLELGSVHAVLRRLTLRATLSKSWVTRSGKLVGGLPFSRGALFHLLRNRTYLGEIVHGKLSHPGRHAPLINAALFATVQDRMSGNRRERPGPVGVAASPLAGRIFDAEGTLMTPAQARNRSRKRYRYYVSSDLQRGGLRQAGDQVIRRVPAVLVEELIAGTLARILPEAETDRFAIIARVEVQATALRLHLDTPLADDVETLLLPGEAIAPDKDHPQRMCLNIPFALRRRGGKTEVIGKNAKGHKLDMVLIRALRSAHAMVPRDPHGFPRIATAPATPYGRKLIRLAFLAPDLQAAILSGSQPQDLTLARLLERAMPPDWQVQRHRFGIPETV